MVKKKRKSKRTTLTDKYKIQRRVVEHHRKQRKQAKRDAKNGVVKHGKKKRDPGIPNSWPFKQDLLNELAKAKERNEEKVRQAKEKRAQQVQELHEHQKKGGSAKTLQELMAQSKAARDNFDSGHNGVTQVGDGGASSETGDNVRIQKNSLGQASRRAYLRELKKVVDSSDVVLQILDARDPMGSRAGRAVENAVLSCVDKKMVLVLNKIDLVPKDAVRGWLKYLRRSHPTVALKAATSDGSSKGDTDVTLGRAKGDNALKSTNAVGVEGLLHLLKNYCRGGDMMDRGGKKGSVVVGIIGYPNVGKSSIINSLKRARAVGVSPRPGFTTSMQEVVLDKNIRLLDSPGVVFDDCEDGDATSANVLLRNCVDVDSAPDPVEVVGVLLRRCTQRSLLMTYAIPSFPEGDENIFLGMIAKKYGKVKKGGIPDKIAAAKMVLKDWNSGKVPYYTPPPVYDVEMVGDGTSTTKDGDAKIVPVLGEEFNVREMGQFDDMVLDSLDSEKDEVDFVEMDTESAVSESHVMRGTNIANALVSGDGDISAIQRMSDGDENMDGSNRNNDSKNRIRTEQKQCSALINDKVADAEDYDFGQL